MKNAVDALVVALAAWTLTATATSSAEEGRWPPLESNPMCFVRNIFFQDNLTATVSWSGACANGRAQGHGIEVWRYLRDGDWQETTYTGQMKDGRWDGRGVAVYADGSTSEGA